MHNKTPNNCARTSRAFMWIGVFHLKHGYRRRWTRVAAWSQGRSWKRTRQAGHFLLPLVTLTRCLHTLSHMKWIKCNICQIHRRFRNVFMSNRNTFYISYCLIQGHLFKNKVLLRVSRRSVFMALHEVEHTYDITLEKCGRARGCARLKAFSSGQH